MPTITEPVIIDGWTQGGAGFTGPPLIELSGASAGASANGLALNLNGGSFPFTVERRDRTIYFAALRNGERENFFGALITSQPVNQTLTLSQVDSATSNTATINVALQGVTMFDHFVAVRLNGSHVGLLSFRGQSHLELSIAVPHSMLTEGVNQVSLVALGGPSDLSLVDSIRITYQHTFVADDDALRLSVIAGQPVAISGFSNERIRVFDVTDVKAIEEIVGTLVKHEDGRYGVALIAQGTGQRQLITLTEDRAKRVAALALKSTSSWRSYVGADFVIVAHPDFFDAAEALKAARQREGLSVAVVDIADIYYEFSYGQKTPQALKDFLYAARRWKKPVRYALFLGDASYDPKNYAGFGNADFVPTKLMDSLFLETASDDWLADFNYNGIADFGIGRLPARTLSEAKLMVAKILSYEESRPSDEALLVSDRNDGFNFEAMSAQLIPLLPGNVRATEIKRGQLGDQLARAMILEAINRGQRIVNYAGHGNVDVWRGGLLGSADASHLQNGGRLSVFVVMNCLNGYFQHPATESLAEALLKSPAGAVAVWASSAMAFADGQPSINQELYRQMYRGTGGVARVGDAAIAAKTATFDEDVRRTWILFGDPTMPITK